MLSLGLPEAARSMPLSDPLEGVTRMGIFGFGKVGGAAVRVGDADFRGGTGRGMADFDCWRIRFSSLPFGLFSLLWSSWKIGIFRT
jgi:hypothetical protein